MIHIRFNCLADVVTAHNLREEKIKQLAEDIKAKALVEWQNRSDDEKKEIRFIQKLDKNFFRFLSVMQQADGSLLVYRA